MLLVEVHAVVAARSGVPSADGELMRGSEALSHEPVIGDLDAGGGVAAAVTEQLVVVVFAHLEGHDVLGGDADLVGTSRCRLVREGEVDDDVGLAVIVRLVAVALDGAVDVAVLTTGHGPEAQGRGGVAGQLDGHVGHADVLVPGQEVEEQALELGLIPPARLAGVVQGLLRGGVLNLALAEVDLVVGGASQAVGRVALVVGAGEPLGDHAPSDAQGQGQVGHFLVALHVSRRRYHTVFLQKSQQVLNRYIKKNGVY